MNLATRVARAGKELGQRAAQELHARSTVVLPGRVVAAPEAVERSRLIDIRNRADRCLGENVLPFWATHAPDRRFGGFITHLDRNGSPSGSTNKYLVMQARLVWTLAAAERYGLSGYLDLAAEGVQFLIESMWDRDHGGFVWAVDRAGHLVDGTKWLYGQAFAMYALAEYALASTDATAREWAERTLYVLQERAGDGEFGFSERFSRDWTVATGKDGTHKTSNAHFHLMEAVTTLVEATDQPAHVALLRRLISLLLSNAIDRRFGCLLETFDRQWRPSTPWRRPASISYGHEVEFAWLMDRALDRLGDRAPEDRRRLVAMIDHALAYGFDHERGGLAQYGPLAGHVRHAVYFHPRRLTRRWWEQAEMLVATLAAHQWTADGQYLRAFAKQFQWIWNYQIDHEHGEWYAATSWPDGRPLRFEKGDEWKCSYHTARALMETVGRLDRLTTTAET